MTRSGVQLCDVSKTYQRVIYFQDMSERITEQEEENWHKRQVHFRGEIKKALFLRAFFIDILMLGN